MPAIVNSIPENLAIQLKNKLNPYEILDALETLSHYLWAKNSAILDTFFEKHNGASLIIDIMRYLYSESSLRKLRPRFFDLVPFVKQDIEIRLHPCVEGKEKITSTFSQVILGVAGIVLSSLIDFRPTTIKLVNTFLDNDNINPN